MGSEKGKKYILECMKKADEASLKEQDYYREIINKGMESDAGEGTKDKSFTWKVILKKMQDCCFPPAHDERERLLKISWDQTLSRTMLEKISDKDIRGRTYFLNETVEHTQRLRSMAMFVERVGPLRDLRGVLFNLWVMRSAMFIIHNEAIQMGKEAEAESARQLCKATDKAADLISREEWDSSTLKKCIQKLT